MAEMAESLAAEGEGRPGVDVRDTEGIEPVRTVAWAPLLGAEISGDDPVPPELLDRRRAVRELGRAIRALGHASVMTEVPTALISQTTQLVADTASILRRERRQPGEISSVDDPFNGVRMYAPMTGEGSPFVPPLTFESVDGLAWASCTLGEEFGGPPRHVHGGVSAMLMDQALGHVVAVSGQPGLTRKLVVQYLRPTPCDVELVVRGRVVASGGRDVFAQAWIATASEPDTPLVKADGHFRILRPEQAAALADQIG